jgi:V/A-type H+/Na+-transporting ATPase subunit A
MHGETDSPRATAQPQADGRSSSGRVERIAGPVVEAVGLHQVRLYDVVRVGERELIGEVIRLSGERVTIQVYEETSGLRVGETVRNTGAPLTVELGPGLLGSIYDGLQRPLPALAALAGPFMARGGEAPALDPARRWPFTPAVRAGDAVAPGDILGSIPETEHIQHRILVPPGVQGRVAQLYPSPFTVADVVAVVETAQGARAVTLSQRWPVRQVRPYRSKLPPNQPLITGTRIIDAVCPVAIGGAAIIPGGFGTGKTVIEQTLARWARTDVVVYIGCGERGNEMAEVLTEFPQLQDPRNSAPLMQRTILIANTSNMPVAAREASIYTGITIAEYYRDMGYDVLLLADSTSRWGEALREVSGRLEEMPGEEGYPAYLAARLAEFYERSGRVACLGRAGAGAPGRADDARLGSVTIVGAVSPPGGDFSEPVTQDSLRVTGAFWALDYDLSRRRHFPAINWLRSYTLYQVEPWYTQTVAQDWPELISTALNILQQEETLLEIVRLVGPDTLAEAQRALLAVARMLREDFLQQSAFDSVDRYCPLDKTYWMLRLILTFNRLATAALTAGHGLQAILNLPAAASIARMKELPLETAVAQLQALERALAQAFAELRDQDSL